MTKNTTYNHLAFNKDLYLDLELAEYSNVPNIKVRKPKRRKIKWDKQSH